MLFVWSALFTLVRHVLQLWTAKSHNNMYPMILKNWDYGIGIRVRVKALGLVILIRGLG